MAAEVLHKHFRVQNIPLLFNDKRPLHRILNLRTAWGSVLGVLRLGDIL